MNNNLPTQVVKAPIQTQNRPQTNQVPQGSPSSDDERPQFDTDTESPDSAISNE